MKLAIGTYNVRGIGARSARTKLRNVILSIKPALDVMAIQEHKLRDSNIDFITSTIWPHATVFNLPAADGLHAQRNPLVSGGKGGVLLLVSPTFCPIIVQHGTIPNEGGLWIHFDTADGRKLGLAAVYAPNTPTERTRLWAALDSSLDASRSWFLIGDFNMIISQNDQIGGRPKIAVGEELSQWTNLVQTLALQDTYRRKTGALHYTWDNRRLALLLHNQGQLTPQLTDGGRILKRLDRVYAEASLIPCHRSTEIFSGSELSDHLPVVAVFQIGPPAFHRNSNYRMNTSLFQDPVFREHIERLWKQWQKRYEDANTPATLTLKYCIKRSSKFLQSDPSNVDTQLKLDEAQKQLATWEAEKARWIQFHLDRKWEEEGKRSTKLFFNSIKSRRRQMNTHAIQDEAGILHSDEDAMLDIAAEYFSNILTEPPPDHLQQTAVQEILGSTNAQVSQEERDSLQQHFTLSDLHTAAKLLGRNKCPGPDGVPLEFFHTFWDTISPLLLQATTEGLQQGTILPFFNRGVITLLHKDGDQTLLKNKRPIMLLNAVYKIWAKAMQLLLTPILQRIITWEQNAFLPGRHLHTTVFLCNEAIQEAKRNDTDVVWLKIDFRKAFDTIRWDFLYSAMQKMQFGDYFISLVAALNTNASSSVRVNNSYDAHLLLIADRQNLISAQNLLHTFGLASGLQVEWGKSSARWLSNSQQRPTWTLDLDWTWVPPDNVEKFLGFYFRDGLDEDGIYEAIKTKVLTKINSPLLRSTTVHGRVVIANHIIYGIRWFVLPIWSANRAKLRKIEGLILRYVWGGNEAKKSRHRVTEKILHQGKIDGGLGLMSLQAQVQAFTAKTMTTTIRLAFEKIIDSTPEHHAAYRSPSEYMTTPSTAPTWCIKLKDNAPPDDSMITTSHADLAFKVSSSKLIRVPVSQIPTTTDWTRAPVATCWTSQKKAMDRYPLKWEEKDSLIASLQWRDQSGFLAAPSANIRKLASTDTSKVKQRLRKWLASHHFDSAAPETWKKIWNRLKPIKYSVLQWYIQFQAIPTNTWRFPKPVGIKARPGAETVKLFS
ncbi:hypothetical protein R1sor_000807 [Riccia sorocarpa]|uniref:Reverse transcriptase domain-containing protein n=1 Tax=Riccia sorocarpa TaxID=122646 RepID=A0ABD3GU56_9MARC